MPDYNLSALYNALLRGPYPDNPWQGKISDGGWISQVPNFNKVKRFAPPFQLDPENILMSSAEGYGGNLGTGEDAPYVSSSTKPASGVLPSFNDRISEAKGNLSLATLTGLLGTFAQNPTVKAPELNDRYLDQMSKGIPDAVKRSANREIDMGVNQAVGNAMASNSGQAGLNAVNAAVASGAEAKGKLAANFALQDTQTQNAYLSAKQQSLDRYNAGVTAAQNQTTDNANTQLGSAAALGTNYFNEMQQAIGNLYQLMDRDRILKSRDAQTQALLAQILKNRNAG